MELRNTHLPAERRQLILAGLTSAGAVRVDELSRSLGVSEMTVRRDLDAMEAEGLLERTHGGAIALKPVTGERRYRDKDEENRGAKEAIGRLAAEMVGENETVLINSGSTTRYSLAYLARRKDIRIITNNVAAVAELPEDCEAEILLLGGRFRNTSGCVVGDWAVRLLEDLAPSRAILGADGISLKEGVSSPIPEEAALTRLMIERTRGPVVIVADAAKIGKICGFRIVDLSEISELLTDGEADSHWVEDFAGTGVKVITAGGTAPGN
jgi:DeoR family fructose operon transcriptional repressor